MQTILIFLGIATITIAFSYLVTVATTWVVLALLHATFGFEQEWNVWLLGALVWIVLVVLQGIFNNKK